MLVFRNTGLDDDRHVAFASLFGELDDVTPYTKLGKKHRLSTPYLFDVSNLTDEGTVAPLDSHRAAMNKVRLDLHLLTTHDMTRSSDNSARAIRSSTSTPPSTPAAAATVSSAPPSSHPQTQAARPNTPTPAPPLPLYPKSSRTSSSPPTTWPRTRCSTAANWPVQKSCVILTRVRRR